MTTSEVDKEILYLRALLRDVGHDIGMCVHFCRELYTDGVIRLIPLRTHLMVADTLTKILPGFLVLLLLSTVRLCWDMLLFTLDFFTSSSVYYFLVLKKQVTSFISILSFASLLGPFKLRKRGEEALGDVLLN